MNDTPTHNAKPRRRSRLRWIVWPLVVLLVCAVAAGWWATRPDRLKRFTISILESATHSSVQLDRARFVLTDGLYLTGLRVSVPGVEHGEVFTAEEIRVNPAWLSLLIGSPAADDIVLVKPTFYLTEDLDSGKYLFQQLQGDTTGSKLTQVPHVTVREGHIAFRELEAGALRELDELEIEGRLSTMEGEPDDYHFTLHEVKPGEGAEATVSGTFNLRQPKLQVVMDGFQFEQPQRYFLRHELREWWGRLDPQGAFSTMAVSFDPEAGWSAQLVLEDASLNVPLGEYVPRMVGVTGRLRVEGHTLILDRLDGDVEGLRYRVTGRVEDVRELEAARFALHAETDWFHIAADPAVIEKLPAVVRKYQARFQPVGNFQLDIDFSRNDPAGKLEYTGLLRITDASGMYHKFRYPAHDVQGEVRFTNDAIVIESLEGRGINDMRFAFESGRIYPPGDGAQVDVAIDLYDVPIDDQLRDAMEPEHRAVLDAFLREDVRSRLVNDKLLDPQWTLGGVIPQLHVAIHRPQGEHVKTAVTSTVRVDGLRMIYKHWPYPMAIDTGSITIAPGRVDVDIAVQGPTGASGRVVGSLERDGDKDLYPDLVIENAVVPVDGLLIASMPQPQDQWVRDLHLDGALRGDGRIYQKQGQTTHFELNARLADAHASPFGGDFPIDALAGDVLIERGRFTINKLAGKHGDTDISMFGVINWSQQPLAADLVFHAANLNISTDVLDLLPHDLPQRDDLLALFDRYQPTGVTDVALDYQRGDPDIYRVVLSPKSLAMKLPDGDAAFTDITGDVVIKRGRVDFDTLSARFDNDSRLSLGGTVMQDDPTWYQLAIGGEIKTVGPTLRAVLPAPASSVIDALKLDGALHIYTGFLSRTDNGFRFYTEPQLDDVNLFLGVPITHLSGSALLTITQSPDQERPQIDLKLDAKRFLAADRLITQLDVNLASNDAGDQLHVDEFVGSIYGGAVLGHGTIQLTDTPRFAFDLTLQDAEVGPFLHPETYTSASTLIPQRDTDTGLVSADLAINQLIGDPKSRIGRGSIEVSHARLYNQPLPLAILQTLNLTLPTDRSFSAASARYLIDGDAVLFDTIRFDAPSLSISGAGTLDWPTQQLDLEMVTRNPGMPDLGAVGEVINKVKDELIAIRITGTLTEPVGRPVTLSGLRRSWDQLFSTKAAHGHNDTAP